VLPILVGREALVRVRENVGVGAEVPPPVKAVRSCDVEVLGVEYVRRVVGEAERKRVKEKGIRELPYTLVPEGWRRGLEESEGNEGREEGEGQQSEGGKEEEEGVVDKGEGGGNGVWNFQICDHFFDVMEWIGSPGGYGSAVTLHTYLHRELGLHVSCGATFGCDYIAYDGDREERHAFAGFRVVDVREGWEGKVRADDLTGWVRAMNTAGKIAVVGFVRGGEVGCVDVVLEKRDIEKWKGKRKRKEVGGEELDKTKT